MPLPSSISREQVHHRSVECKAYLREDGLWDIEGNVVDTKSYSFPAPWKSVVPAGEAIHNMWVRLTVNEDMEVKDVETAMDSQPYWTCSEILPNFKELIGLKIGKGWNRAVKERVGGRAGCTHIVELLGPVATTAFQAIGSMKYRRRRLSGDTQQPQTRPGNMDTCFSWSSEGEMVRNLYPQWYTGDKDVPEKPAYPVTGE